MKEMMVAIKDIVSDSNRQYGGDGDIRLLADDMKEVGQINAITLCECASSRPEGGGYKIIAGRRRKAAALLLGWEKIRATVYEVGEEINVDAIAASENVNRLAMHPLDEAEIFRRLIERGETLESLTKRYDRTKAAIWQRVQLLDLNAGIKELFRDGKISLHAAAMLKSLNAEQQEAFCKHIKEFTKYKFEGGKHVRDYNISDNEVSRFIAGVFNDKLYKCIAGAECQACQKRTFFSDKGLFPELRGEEDKCLDHECYVGKWTAMLSRRIKGIVGEHKDHKGASIIVTEDRDIGKILGKNFMLDGVGYSVKVADFFGNALLQKAEKNSAPCFEFIMHSDGKLTILSRYWKEPEKKQARKPQGGSFEERAFAPMAKLLELSKEEAKQTAAAVVKKSINSCELENKVQEKVFENLLKIKAERPDDNRDIDRFIKRWQSDCEEKTNIQLFASFAGQKKDLKKLSISKLFAALYAGSFDWYDLPSLQNISTEKQDHIAEWAGVSMDKLRDMYREELRALMPKPESSKEKDAKKTSKKKAGVQKCRVCGCTDDDCRGCIEETGEPCHWVEDDLCSACAAKEKANRKKPAPKTAKKKPAVKKQPARKVKAKKKAAAPKTLKAKKPAVKKQAARTAAKKPGRGAAANKRTAKSAVDGDPSMEM